MKEILQELRKASLKDWVLELYVSFLGILALGLIMPALLIFVYEVFYFAKIGEWPHLTLIKIMGWESLETNWVGLYKVFSWLPAYAALFFFVVVLIVLGRLVFWIFLSDWCRKD